MSVFSTGAKNVMLDVLEPDQLRLHDGDPGSDGTANRVGGADGIEAATFSAASSGSRQLSAPVEFENLGSMQPVTWFSVWDDTVFLGKAEVTSGDTTANALGEWTAETASALTIADS